MSDTLFDTAPTARTGPTERTMIDLLVRRYTRISYGAHRYAYADHVPDRPGFAGRIADFIALDTYIRPRRSWADPVAREIHGHEIKVTRADWLTELRDPTKAEAFRPYCTRWWLVVPDRSIVHLGELPDGWGLLAGVGQLRAVVKAPEINAEPMPQSLMIGLARAVAKTARQETRAVMLDRAGGER